MNKEFIPYIEASKLRKLGFNEDCFARYLMMYEYALHLEYSKKEEFNHFPFTILAPTYSQAFRYIREEYKIKHEILCGDDCYYFMYEYSNMPKIQRNYTYYKTYEEAEYNCLVKLLEIIEQKKYMINNKDEETIDSIVNSVINKFKNRSELGIKKYNTTLERTDISTFDWIEHLQSELMDGILYAERLKQEYNEKHENMY